MIAPLCSPSKGDSITAGVVWNRLLGVVDPKSRNETGGVGAEEKKGGGRGEEEIKKGEGVVEEKMGVEGAVGRKEREAAGTKGGGGVDEKKGGDEGEEERNGGEKEEGRNSMAGWVVDRCRNSWNGTVSSGLGGFRRLKMLREGGGTRVGKEKAVAAVGKLGNCVGEEGKGNGVGVVEEAKKGVGVE